MASRLWFTYRKNFPAIGKCPLLQRVRDCTLLGGEGEFGLNVPSAWYSCQSSRQARVGMLAEASPELWRSWIPNSELRAAVYTPQATVHHWGQKKTRPVSDGEHSERGGAQAEEQGLPRKALCPGSRPQVQGGWSSRSACPIFPSTSHTSLWGVEGKAEVT